MRERRREFTPEEDDLLRRLNADRLSPPEIGRKIGRQKQCVRQRLIALGLDPVVKQSAKPLSDEETARVMQLRFGENLPVREIAKRLGRSIAAVHDKLKGINAEDAAREAVLVSQLVDERVAREEARDRLSLTGWLLGDPPPGYSALDRKSAP